MPSVFSSLCFIGFVLGLLACLCCGRSNNSTCVPGNHAANHNKVLEKLGATMDPIDIQIHVGTTAENLKAAIAGETHEFESMYPEFIAVAEEEGQKAAVRSFTWATEAEKEHADFYAAALKALENGDTSALPRQYWVCLVCGDTFKSLEGVDACPLCGTKAEKFLVIG